MGNLRVYGRVIDDETRCVHYSSEVDRIAIKFYCCGRYYPCYECYEETGCGQPEVWPADKFHRKAVLCGNCRSELTVNEYLTCGHSCPVCSAEFNPGCSLHKELYFS